MSLIEILVIVGLMLVIGLAAWWFAAKEQKTMQPGPREELDPHTQEAMRRSTINSIDTSGNVNL